MSGSLESLIPTDTPRDELDLLVEAVYVVQRGSAWQVQVGRGSARSFADLGDALNHARRLCRERGTGLVLQENGRSIAKRESQVEAFVRSRLGEIRRVSSPVPVAR